jgi:hypothetical protein
MFIQIEEQKLDRQARDIEFAAQRKVDSVRADSDNMLRNLTAQQQSMELSENCSPLFCLSITARLTPADYVLRF